MDLSSAPWLLACTHTLLKESVLTPSMSQTGAACWWAWLCNVPLIHTKLVRAVKGQP